MRSQFELRRDFEALAGLTALPFTVVASDGSGDYTSIKTAVEAQAQTGNASGQAPAIIFVKPGTYTDGNTATVDLTNRNIVLVGSFAPGAGRPSTQGYAETQWTVGGFRITGAVNGQLIMIGLRVVSNSAFLDGSTTASSFVVGMYGCEVSHSGSNGMFGQTCTINYWAMDSSLGPLCTGASVRVQECNLSRCLFTFGTTAGITLSGFNGYDWNISRCTVTASTFAMTSSSSGQGSFIMSDSILASAFGLTVTGFNRVSIVGCENSDGDTAATLSISGQGTNASRTVAVVSGNNLPATDLVITGAAHTNTQAKVDGTYRTLTLGVDAVEADVTFRSRTTEAVSPFLTINNSAIACLVNMTIDVPVNGSKAWVVTDGNHVISCAGYSQANLSVASSPAPPAAPGAGIGGSATCWFTVT